MISTVVERTEQKERSYQQRVHQFPMLSAEEERALWRRWHDNQDVAAAHRLVTSHMRLVTKLARGFSGYGLPAEELVSEGNVGLMQALKRFDPERGFRFATYALWWIRAAMHEHVLHNWSLVKMGTTGSQKRLFFNLRRLKAQMDSTGGDSEPTAEQIRQIADTLSVPEQDVISMSQRLAGRDYSLNVPAGIRC